MRDAVTACLPPNFARLVCPLNRPAEEVIPSHRLGGTGAPLMDESTQADKVESEAPKPAEALPAAWHVGLFSQICSKHTFCNFALSVCCPCVRFSLTAVRSRVSPRLGFCGWFLLYFIIMAVAFAPWGYPWCPNSSNWAQELTNGSYFVELLNPGCGVMYLSVILLLFVSLHKRWHLRTQYGLATSPAAKCTDCLFYIPCYPCYLAQDSAHVDIEERGVVVGDCCPVQARMLRDDEAVNVVPLPVP